MNECVVDFFPLGPLEETIILDNTLIRIVRVLEAENPVTGLLTHRNMCVCVCVCVCVCDFKLLSFEIICYAA